MNPVQLRAASMESVPEASAPGVLEVTKKTGGAARFSRVLGPMLQAAAQAATPASDSAHAEAPPSEVRVQRGQTLTAIVRQQWEAAGGASQALSDAQAHRWALQVARDNRLADPNRILPGQLLNVRLSIEGPILARSDPPLPQRSTAETTMAAAPVQAVSQGVEGLAHPVLGRTLDRAIARGYVPVADRQAVAHRIERLADKHGFKPDDFARAVLMESDGLNPRASNGRCFGIIQFCNGPDRGAASAGYGRNAHEIVRLSVLEQLDLVDRYFDDTRLSGFRRQGQSVPLDDLYLTILMPAARQVRRLDAALPIPGHQALDLHAQRDRQQPITRQSILSGLYANARGRLGQLLMANAGN